MPIPGNPRDFARDIAEGFFIFNQATCRQFTPQELKTIYHFLEQVSRETRAEQIPADHVVEVQKRNLKIGRANNALLFIRNHAKRSSLVL
jgi:hypothetical protein